MLGDMSYARAEFLAETDWLDQQIGNPGLRIFDVTGMLTGSFQNIAKERAFDPGHIPGARFLNVAGAKGALSNRDAPLPWTWPTLLQFERDMSEAGVDNDSTVVLYASTPRVGVDLGIMWATRAWWVMHHFGVNCRVLNGGWEKWIAEGRRVSTESAVTSEARFTVSPGWQRGVASKADVLETIAGSGSACVIDALSEASFAGLDRARYGPRKGHILGAVNVPMTRLLDPGTGAFKAAHDIRSAFEREGVQWNRPVIAYCGGAIAATVDAFALTLCGHENVAVYDGSLMEWAADPTLPMIDPSASASS